MPVFIAWIGEMLLALAGSFLLQLLVSAGVGVVTLVGVNATLGWLKGQAIASAVSLGPQVIGMLSTLKVGQCISIIFSAIAVRATINGVTSDTFKKFVKK